MGYLLDTMTPKPSTPSATSSRTSAGSRSREPALRHWLTSCSTRCSTRRRPSPLAGHRLHGRSHRRELRRRRGVLQEYYAPSNASLVVAGDLDAATARRLVEKWFGDVKAGAPLEPMTIPGIALSGVKKKTITDRVQLPRLYLAWPTPRQFEPGDAALDAVSAVLAGGKNSRLFKRLVYDMQIAQDVSAFQSSQALSSTFQIVATPRPGHTVAELQKVIDEELVTLQREPPAARELERSVNQVEASFYDRMERVGGFGGKADQLNAYYTGTGDPDWFNEDLARYRALSVGDVSAAAAQFLPLDKRIELIVEPEKTAARHP
jgi:zinc protease